MDIRSGEMVFPSTSYSEGPEYTVEAPPVASERYPGYVWVHMTMPNGSRTARRIKDTKTVITEIA